MKFKHGLKENMTVGEIERWFKNFISKEIEKRLNEGERVTGFYPLIEDDNDDCNVLALYSSNVCYTDYVRFTIDVNDNDFLIKEIEIYGQFKRNEEITEEQLNQFTAAYIEGKELFEQYILNRV